MLNGTATIDPATHDLVVDYVSFDHNEAGTGGQFFPGANSAGQTGPSYVAADDCGIPDPVALADLGFPDSHNVLVVNGTEGGDPCEANFVGQPTVRRTERATSVRFQMSVEHNRGGIRMPVTAQLEDFSGNVYGFLNLGTFTFNEGEAVALEGTLKAPGDMPSGDYVLKVRMENMKGFVTRNQIVRIR